MLAICSLNWDNSQIYTIRVNPSVTLSVSVLKADGVMAGTPAAGVRAKSAEDKQEEGSQDWGSRRCRSSTNHSAQHPHLVPRPGDRYRAKDPALTGKMMICFGGVCVPLNLLLPFLVGLMHRYGFFQWLKPEYVTFRYWKKRCDRSTWVPHPLRFIITYRQRLLPLVDHIACLQMVFQGAGED